MKKTIYLGLLLVVAFLFFGCQNKDIAEKSTTQTTVAPTEETETLPLPPHVPSGYTWEDLRKPTPDHEVPEGIASPEPAEDGLVMETYYGDNIIFKTEQTEYSVNTEKIIGFAIDTNPGICFRFHINPCLERYSDGEWVRMAYYPQGFFFEDQWMYTLSAPKGEADKGVAITLLTQYVYEELTPGRYRLVAFVGDGKFYSEFDLVE